ncbi:hypothetical protein Goari_018191 [Gossypium aridum]|uniref:RNase H type-1 domain-containing protein n=1 Tax=Gossypium aridum TaxID=34290 RepID=A0A7J8WNU4_GOSAI|nr:hypothetical protein [Gossypium aridum]
MSTSFINKEFTKTDGAIQVMSGSATAGRVLCNENGDWILGYNKFLRNCSIFYTEFWGILNGLKLIQRRGHESQWALRYILRE